MPELNKNLKKQDYEKLGELLVSLGELGMTDDARKKIYRMSFIKGIIAGLGGVIGATIVVALLLFILSLFNEVPLIGNLTEALQNTINSAEN